MRIGALIRFAELEAACAHEEKGDKLVGCSCQEHRSAMGIEYRN